MILTQLLMIRPATPDDKKAIMAIAEAIGLFSPQELEELGGMLTEYFDGNLGGDHFGLFTTMVSQLEPLTTRLSSMLMGRGTCTLLLSTQTVRGKGLVGNYYTTSNKH